MHTQPPPHKLPKDTRARPGRPHLSTRAAGGAESGKEKKPDVQILKAVDWRNTPWHQGVLSINELDW